MADNRKPYTVTIGGIEHTLLLTAEDADRYGDDAVKVKAAEEPSNKSRTAQNK
jgi:hypothetical protein